MNAWDYLVLFGTIAVIAVYGILRTRGRRNLHDYLRGKRHSWLAIGLSVMATQASAITFLSTPGQGYADGLSFVQNYFAVPLALVIIAAFFLPIYRKLNVYTAYEFLGTRFDKKTRLLAAALFLFQRGIGAGFTIYAPAIVLSTVFGWSLEWTIILSGLVVIAYTVVGGSDAVTHTQKYQIAIIFAGMIAAFWILLSKIPCSFPDALALAGHFGKLNAVSFSTDPDKRYTFWTGMFGGIFLMLSYFGTDQSQVQRYISGDDLRESRLGLMFNALFKIPMQFFILLLGVMLFVFYQFHPVPMFFNRSAWNAESHKIVHAVPKDMSLAEVQGSFQQYHEAQKEVMREWTRARQQGDVVAEGAMLRNMDTFAEFEDMQRQSIKNQLKALNPQINTNDSDYVFITFILDNLPHGLIGLLVCCFFLAALSSKAAELNALASCSVIDFYRYIVRPPKAQEEESEPQQSGSGSAQGTHKPLPDGRGSDDKHKPLPHGRGSDDKTTSSSDRHYVRVSKAFTLFWGLFAIGFALVVRMAENLIQATNIVASLFYGTVLGLFLIAFFLKPIRGTPAFCGALIAQGAVLVMYYTLPISYLWYNLIGCVVCVICAGVLQLLLGTPKPPQGFPVIMSSPREESAA